MKPRTRRILCGSAIALGVLLAGVAFAGWFLLGTDRGSPVLLSALGGVLPGALDIGAVDGPIRGPLVIHDLAYRTDNVKVSIERIELDWHLRDLTRRKIDVLWLEATGVEVVTEQREDPGEEVRDPLVDFDLGWDIEVRRAEVQDIAVLDGAGAERTRIDWLSLAGHTDGTTVHVEHLTGRGPDLEIDASGQVVTTGDWPILAAVEWSVRTPGPRLAGKGDLGGSLEALTFDHELTAPATAHVHGRLDHLFTAPSVELTLQTGGLDVRRLAPQAPQATVRGTVSARGSFEQLSGSADLHVDTVQYGPLVVAGNWSWSPDEWTFARLGVATPEGTIQARLGGRYVTGDRGGFEIGIEWSRLAWPLHGEPTVWSGEGRAEIAGRSNAWTIDYRGSLIVPEVVEGHLDLVGHGGPGGLAVKSARYLTLGGSVTGDGRVSWGAETAWSFAIHGRGLDPAPFVAGLSGALDVETRVSGRMAGEEAEGAAAPVEFSGTLNGKPITGAVQAVLHAGQRITLEEAHATWAGADLTLHGDVAEPLDLSWQASVPRLEDLVEGARGSISGSGHIAGSYAEPILEGHATGERIEWMGLAATALGARAYAGLGPSDPLELTLSGTDVVLAGLAFSAAVVESSGTAGAHRLSATLTGDEHSIDLAAAGGLAGGMEQAAWSGTLERFRVDSADLGGWTLERPAAAALSRAGGGAIEPACLLSDPGRLCVEGGFMASGGWKLVADVERVPLALARGWLPEDVEVEGFVNGTLDATSGADGALAGNAAFDIGPGALVYTVRVDGVDQRARLTLAPSRLTATATPAELEAAVALRFEDTGTLEGSVVAAGSDLAEHRALRGRLRANLDDLAFVAALHPGVQDARGRLDADVSLGGTVGAPQIAGSAELAKGRATLGDLGITVEGIEVRLREFEGAVAHIEGKARSGEGQLTVSGQLSVDPSDAEPVRLHIEGERFLASDTAQARVVITPDLDVVYTGALVRVTGQVRAPEVAIVLRESEHALVRPSRDVVLVGEAAEVDVAEEAGLSVEARVRLVLGDAVELTGMGIDARLEGTLLIQEDPGLPTRAVGEIRVAEGSYRAYGQDLTVERGGRLYFGGGVIANPGLELRAVREAADGVRAGLDVRGTLEKPEVELWSDPPLTQAEQLSYVVLGRGLDEASQADGDALSQAAGSLGVRGGNLLGKKIASQFGLAEVTVEAEDGYEEAAVVLGKYLSPELYVSYGIGLFEPVNVFHIRYEMSRTWQLEAETGDGTSGDLVYTVERGRGKDH